MPDAKMRITTIAVFGLVLLVFGSSASARKRKPVNQEQLQQEILREILSEETDQKPVKPNKSKQIDSSQNETKQQLPGVGTSVASVPTWPVMVLVVLLAGVLLWAKKTSHSRNQPGVINKLATVPLGSKRSLALVEVMGQKLVLGMSEKGLSLLAKIEGDDLNADPNQLDVVTDAADMDDPQQDPFEDELRHILAGSAPESRPDMPLPAERRELARKFRHLRS